MRPVMDNKGSNCIKEVFSVKAIAALFLSMLLLFSASHAEILHSPEVDPDFAGIGISAHEAIVLTDNLPLYASSSGNQVLAHLPAGQAFYTAQAQNDRLDYYNVAGQRLGWVCADDVLQWPSYLVLESDTNAFAAQGEDAPCVRLTAGARLPLLDSLPAGYTVLGEGGARLWIAAQDTPQTPFSPALLPSITGAELRWLDASGVWQRSTLTDEASLSTLRTLLSAHQEVGALMAGCPFGRRLLTLTFEGGAQSTLDLACDSCCIFRVEGREFRYAHGMYSANGKSPSSDLLFCLFSDVLVMQ